MAFDDEPRNQPTEPEVPSPPEPPQAEAPPPPPVDVPPPPPAEAAPSPAPQPAGKADLGKRFVAALIDGIIAFIVGLIPFIGWLIGAAYMLLRDGLEIDFMNRRSLGKKLFKLRPVRLDGRPMDLGTSAKRNFVFAIGPIGEFFLIIPVVGWAIAILLGLAALVLVIIEIILVATDAEGRRLGDKVAGTKVVEVNG